MRPFRDQPIRRKLMWLTLGASVLPLVLILIGIFAYDLITYRAHLERDVHDAADFVAANSAATLAFDDAETAQETLATLRAWPDIARAALYTADGTLFASYSSGENGGEALPYTSLGPEGLRLVEGHFELLRPVEQQQKRLGLLFVQADTANLYERLRRYAGILLATTTALAGGALLMLVVLQRLVSAPILRLSGMAKSIGHGHLGTRVPVESHDEVGQLADAFNRMSAELAQSYANLEERVHQRTAALAQSNAELQAEITERKRVTAALQRTAAELGRSNRDLEDFANVASHDLQEPLRKITAFGDLLKAQAATSLTGESKDYLERMLHAASRMRRLIDDLLVYARLATRTHPNVEVDLAKVAHEVLEDLAAAVARVNGRVEVGPLCVVQADETQMRQLLQNLIGNALKFHKPDEAPEVKLYREDGDSAANAEGDWCQFVVEDNGIGFEEKYAQRIFGVFQRLHGQQAYEGSGIGLAVCQKIVRRHSGTIVAEGRPGVGARFVVRLPRHQAPEVIEES